MKGALPSHSNPLITLGARGEAVPSREYYDFFLKLSGLLDGSNGGIPVADGDYGDIVVSGGGTVWTFDPAVVTAFSRTLLDDADAASWRTDLGIDAGTTPYTPADVDDWGGADPGDVDDALDYLAAGAGYLTPTLIEAGRKFRIRANTQMLFCIVPTIDGTLTIDGTYCEVS